MDAINTFTQPASDQIIHKRLHILKHGAQTLIWGHEPYKKYIIQVNSLQWRATSPCNTPQQGNVSFDTYAQDVSEVERNSGLPPSARSSGGHRQCELWPAEGSTEVSCSLWRGWRNSAANSQVCVVLCGCVAAASSVPGTNQLKLEADNGVKCSEDHRLQLPSHNALCLARCTSGTGTVSQG